MDIFIICIISLVIDNVNIKSDLSFPTGRADTGSYQRQAGDIETSETTEKVGK